MRQQQKCHGLSRICVSHVLARIIYIRGIRDVFALAFLVRRAFSISNSYDLCFWHTGLSSNVEILGS